jgi:hypothetical protein
MFCMRKIVVIAFQFCLVVSAHAGLQVVYPKDESQAADARFDDLHEILRTALEKTVPKYGPYELKPSAFGMTESRYLFELRNGKTINIAWSATTKENEADFLPVRIPLRKGILGYRIALIAKNNQDKIDRVMTLADLRKLSIGQGIGWSDVRLYGRNGIDVQTANYDLLFRMLNAGRFDLFPRGINEYFMNLTPIPSIIRTSPLRKTC